MYDNSELEITGKEEGMIRSCEFFNVEFTGMTRSTLKKVHVCLAKEYKKECPFPEKECLMKQ